MLQALIDSPVRNSIVAVGSDVPDAPALARAHQVGIPTFAVPLDRGVDRAEWNEKLLAALRTHRPDWIVSAGFMRILGPVVVRAFSERIVNTHPALLPAFPGAHAVRDALAYGVRVTGCTVHLVDEGVDTGPIIAQRAVEVCADDDEATLHERIKVIERELLVTTLIQMGAA